MQYETNGCLGIVCILKYLLYIRYNIVFLYSVFCSACSNIYNEFLTIEFCLHSQTNNTYKLENSIKKILERKKDKIHFRLIVTLRKYLKLISSREPSAFYL